MSRRTQAKAASLTAWSGVAHARIRHDVLNSPAWRALSFSAKALYVDLRGKVRSTNNGNINATLAEMKHRGWVSSSTLSNALRELEALGFIAKTRQGGITSCGFCCLYRFTDLPTGEWPNLGIAEHKATCDWLRFESVSDAVNELRQKPKRKNKRKLRKSNGTCSKIEVGKPFTDSKFEQGGILPIRNSKRQKLATH